MGAGTGHLILAADKELVGTAMSGVAAVVLTGKALVSWRKKWEVDDTPTSTCRGVFVGRNEVVGRVVPTHQALTAPFSASACVWFEWHLERYRSNDDGGSWVTVERRSTAAPFWLEDDTGRVLLRPRGADLEPEQTLCSGLGRNYAPPYSRWQLRQWVLVGEDLLERRRSLADPSFFELPAAGSWLKSGTAEPISALSGRNRITERVLRAGQPAYVLGHARPRPDAPGLEFDAEAGPLLVTTKSEEEVSRSTGSSARWTGLLAIALSAVFSLLLSNVVAGEHHASWPIATVVAELGVLLGVALVRNYNRHVIVKEQAAKAWSMIEVSLRRRADLLPNLARVAESYAGHERDVATAVAGLRADHALPVHQDLPGEETLAAAEASDRGQRAAAAGAFALVEAHPQLKADAVFVDLQRRIVDAEESVASARTFYNEAINVLRDRRQQFPGNLFARLVEVPTWRLFEAEEMALAAPPIAIAPDRPDEHEPHVPTGPVDPTAGTGFVGPSPGSPVGDRPEGRAPNGGSAF